VPASFTPPDLNRIADSCPISAVTVDVDFQVSDYATNRELTAAMHLNCAAVSQESKKC
jgi:hypothetical protein